MAQIDPKIIAQFSIDFPNDTLVGESFGMDNASFTIITPNQNYSINFDADSQASDQQRQVLVSAAVPIGLGVSAEGPVLVSPLAGPPVGLDITSTQIVAGVFAPTNSTNIYQFTVIRQGAVS